MTGPSPTLHAAVLLIWLSPLVLLGVLSISSLLRRPLEERTVARLTATSLIISFGAAVSGTLAVVFGAEQPRVLSYGTWFSFGRDAFALDFIADGLSLGFVTLSTAICGVVAAFSLRYLHREPGFHRYFVQFAMFVVGIALVSVAGSIEILFAGWELLGLSSALLVGFFHDRPAPVTNALRVFAVYRASDAAMLSAAVLLHHWAGSGSLSLLFSSAPDATRALDPGQALVIALLILVAVAGKSALLPFSGWLPRAMEGPTPSSAVFYGALSIHAGCYLLLRAEPLLAQSDLARGLAALAGITTAVYATVTARVQTDVKSALSYAALTQVGIIIVEIAFGFTTLAFVHMIGHATFRLLQFLSAPNILHDLHELERRTGADRDSPAPALRSGHGIYLFALERGFADSLLDRFVVEPFRWLTSHADRWDRLLSGSRPPDEDITREHSEGKTRR
jgi:NADH-quinone oxidoreductase subunit L